MTWMRYVSYSLARKSAWWEVWYACLLHPCREQEKAFITILLCADKVSLFIQRGRDKLWMKHCWAEREKEQGKRDMVERGNRQGSSLVFNCLCVSMWADGIYWKTLLAQLVDCWPPAITPFQPSPLPPAFPASTCTALIHSHYKTACIMLSNEINP